MTYSTLDGLRTSKLNNALGLSADGDTYFGSTSLRNLALQDACARLWPEMARLTRETDIAIAQDQTAFTLSAIRDVISVTVFDEDGEPVKELTNFRQWVDEAADPPTVRLEFANQPSATTDTLTVMGYAPYTVPSSGSSSFDIEPRFEHILIQGALAYVYRWRLNQFMDFERHQNENRTNAVTAETLMRMEATHHERFLGLVDQHKRSFRGGRNASLRYGGRS